MTRMPAILYDGWALAYRPTSWEAIHLLSVLATLPAGTQARVALPAEPFELLPAGIDGLLQPVENTSWGRLRWEQTTLPHLARSSGTDVLHLMSPRAALFSAMPQVVSPSGFDSAGALLPANAQAGDRESAEADSLVERLSLAFGQGGFSRSAALFWPADLPIPGLDVRVVDLPPLVHPRFLEPVPEASLPDLPETYILYHGPQSRAALHRLVEAWSWASGSVGEYYPLLVLGFGPAGSARLNALLEKAGLAKTVRVLPPISLETTIYLYQHCTAVFHPAGIAPWGGPLRTALWCGRPLVALETQHSDALVGEAGYLVKPGRADTGRSLGAALITVIVEESVATSLAQAARQRTQRWENSSFPRALAAAYQAILAER